MSARHLVVCVAVAVCACGAEEEPIASIDVLDGSATSDAVEALDDAPDAVDSHEADDDTPTEDLDGGGPDALDGRADAADDRTDGDEPDAGDAGIGDACIEDVLPVHGAPCDCFRRRFYLEDETYCTVTVSCSLRGVDEATDTWYYHWQTKRGSTCGFPDQWGRDTDAID